MKQKRLIVIWYENELRNRVWHLRSIRRDGHIFGEVRDNIGRYAKTVEIVIRDNDIEKIFELADRISQTCSLPDESEVRVGWLGLLARGSLSNAKILTRYYLGDQADESESFLEIIKTLSPYVTPHIEVVPLPK